MKNEQKNKGNITYGKILFAGVLLFLLIITAVYFVAELIVYTSEVISESGGSILEDAEDKFQENIDSIKCEIEFEGINYKGVCTEEVIQGFADYIMLTKCMNRPNNYMFSVCNRLME